VEAQQHLFGHEEPAFDPSFSKLHRTPLSTDAWADFAEGWLEGHARLFDALESGTSWRTVQETLYDKTLTAPRLVATLPQDGPGHPIVDAMAYVLSERYQLALERVSLALYRNGDDSVAWHGDRIARQMPATIVATVSVGSPRRFLLRPRGGGRSTRFNLGAGDLLVMGGSSQRTWQHSVPKVARAYPRIAIMFRPLWKMESEEYA